MHKEAREELRVRLKLVVLEFADQLERISDQLMVQTLANVQKQPVFVVHAINLLAIRYRRHQACQEFNIPRASFYRWKQRYEKTGRTGLFRKRSIAYHHSHKTPPEWWRRS